MPPVLNFDASNASLPPLAPKTGPLPVPLAPPYGLPPYGRAPKPPCPNPPAPDPNGGDVDPPELAEQAAAITIAKAPKFHVPSLRARHLARSSSNSKSCRTFS